MAFCAHESRKMDPTNGGGECPQLECPVALNSGGSAVPVEEQLDAYLKRVYPVAATSIKGLNNEIQGEASSLEVFSKLTELIIPGCKSISGNLQLPPCLLQLDLSGCEALTDLACEFGGIGSGGGGVALDYGQLETAGNISTASGDDKDSGKGMLIVSDMGFTRAGTVTNIEFFAACADPALEVAVWRPVDANVYEKVGSVPIHGASGYNSISVNSPRPNDVAVPWAKEPLHVEIGDVIGWFSPNTQPITFTPHDKDGIIDGIIDGDGAMVRRSYGCDSSTSTVDMSRHFKRVKGEPKTGWKRDYKIAVQFLPRKMGVSLSSLANHIALVHINLYECTNLSHSSLEPFSGCVNLSHLKLGGWGAAWHGTLQPLAHLRKLRFLFIQRSRIIGTVEPLEHLTDLTTIDLELCPSLTGDLGALAGLASLTCLNFSGCYLRFQDTGISGSLAPLSSLKRLRTLKVSGCEKIDGDLQALGACTSLTELSIGGCRRLVCDLPTLGKLMLCPLLTIMKGFSHAGESFNAFVALGEAVAAYNQSQQYGKVATLEAANSFLSTYAGWRATCNTTQAILREVEENEMIFFKDVFNRLLGGLPGNEGDVEYMLLRSADLEILGASNVLLKSWCAKGTAPVAADPGNRRACDVGSMASDQNVKALFSCLGAHLGRYRVQQGAEIHRSKTCVVRFAEDVAEQPACRGVLKAMKNRDEFEREIFSRRDARGKLHGVVIGILGWHCPTDEPPVEGVGLRRERKALDDPQDPDYPYLLFLERGAQSVYLSIASRRFAGYDAAEVSRLFSRITAKVVELHETGLVHGDVKPRNVLLAIEPSEDVLLCDLDAAERIGVERSRGAKLGSTGYQAPESYRWSLASTSLHAAASLDVWSLGVVLYELCSGRHLFKLDLSNDNLVSSDDDQRLRTWLCISNTDLGAVFRAEGDDRDDSVRCSAAQRDSAIDLIRWCLQGRPEDRPSPEQMLAHPFLGGTTPSPAPEHVVVVTGTEPVLSRVPSRLVYHVFLSHFQIEASGDAGTLFHLFANVGLSSWRDMNQKDLTTQGMRQGVRDSEVFVLLLTNRVLSRKYCLMELKWALEFEKPIIIVIEREERFAAFDLERWKEDKCRRSADGKSWVHDTDLQTRYKDCPQCIRDLIEERVRSASVLPLRRRDYEANALVREVFRIAGSRHGLDWASVPASLSDHDLISAPRDVVVLAHPSPRAQQAKADLEATLVSLSKGAAVCMAGENSATVLDASHVLVVLSSGLLQGVLQDESSAISLAVQHKPHDIVFVYLEPPEAQAHCHETPNAAPHGSAEGDDESWDFGAFYSLPDSNCKAAIANSEALKYRPPIPPHHAYQHTALVAEVLRRMRVF